MTNGELASTIIAGCICVVLILIVPLTTLMNRMDDVVQEEVQLIVEEFVADMANTGVLTREKYQNLQNRLDATGKVYEIDMQVMSLDENPGKKTAQANYTKIGENVYVVYYTTQILPKIGVRVSENDVVDPNNYEMEFKTGDIFSLQVKSDTSAAKDLESSLLSVSNAGEYVVVGSDSKMVTVEGSSNQ